MEKYSLLHSCEAHISFAHSNKSVNLQIRLKGLSWKRAFVIVYEHCLQVSKMFGTIQFLLLPVINEERMTNLELLPAMFFSSVK